MLISGSPTDVAGRNAASPAEIDPRSHDKRWRTPRVASHTRTVTGAVSACTGTKECGARALRRRLVVDGVDRLPPGSQAESKNTHSPRLPLQHGEIKDRQ